LKCFIDKNLWDEARIFTGNKIAGRGIAAPTINVNTKKKNQETMNFVFYIEKTNKHIAL
jgi:riboflavin biosynthesis pyrimidine reductase